MQLALKVIVLQAIICLSFFLSNAQTEKFLPASKRVGSFYNLKKIWKPEYFQGNKKSKKYFEGWYFKVVANNGEYRFAFIPGISLGDDKHSFIQVVDGETGKTAYYRFPIDSFFFSSSRFAIKIGKNFFSADSFNVDLGEGEQRI